MNERRNLPWHAAEHAPIEDGHPEKKVNFETSSKHSQTLAPRAMSVSNLAARIHLEKNREGKIRKAFQINLPPICVGGKRMDEGQTERGRPPPCPPNTITNARSRNTQNRRRAQDYPTS